MDEEPGDSILQRLADRARAAGREAFSANYAPTTGSIAPGRLELLGNHVDYNGGPVLAAAIDRVVLALFDLNGRPGEIAAVAPDVSTEALHVSIDQLDGWRADGGEPDPRAYLSGAISALRARGHEIEGGHRVSISGSVPLGFGMSSSAALCVALVNALPTQRLEPHEVVLTAQEAEHRAGTPCGTMDQSASVAGQVIRYDGADDSFTVLEPDLNDYVFAVADSGVTRALGTSSYGVRVEEAKHAVTLLREHLRTDLTALGQLTERQWREIERHGEAWLPAPLFARVRHVYTECARVRHGLAAVDEGDWPRFGSLMTESGRSSAGDYEISHPSVEELVAEVLTHQGVLGARMMGGGEGGPALILLQRQALPALEGRLRAGYFDRHGMNERDDLIQACRFGPGARVVTV